MTTLIPEAPAPSEAVRTEDGWQENGWQYDSISERPPMLDGSGVETAIVLEVTAALVANPPRELTVIEVMSREGVVTLKGQVGNTQLHTMAGEIASSHPGVEETVNALEIHGRVDADHALMI